MVLVMQSEKRGVKIDPTFVLQGLTDHRSEFNKFGAQKLIALNHSFYSI